MLAKRIIACLDIKDGRCVKGIQFKELQDAGDPIALAKKYSDEGVDELVFLDISASIEKRKTMAELVLKIAREIQIPFTVGGGVASVEDAKRLLDNGADKVVVNSAAVKRPALINELAAAFGKQCVVLAIDAKNIGGEWKVHLMGGSQATDLNLIDWATEGEQRGAGEILFTSMDNDGEKGGFAINALKTLNKQLSVPLIASGGAGKWEDFKTVFEEANVDGALAASVFHYQQIEIMSLKKSLKKLKISIR